MPKTPLVPLARDVLFPHAVRARDALKPAAAGHRDLGLHVRRRRLASCDAVPRVPSCRCCRPGLRAGAARCRKMMRIPSDTIRPMFRPQPPRPLHRPRSPHQKKALGLTMMWYYEFFGWIAVNREI